MSFDAKPLGRALSIVLATASVFTLWASPSAKAQPVLYVKVFDTTTQSGAQNTVIPIYMNNYQDSVAAFNLWIVLDRSDIMEFQTDSATVIDTSWWECVQWDDTVCVEWEETGPAGNWDSIGIDTLDVVVGNFDTTNALTQGWEMVDARSLGGAGFDLNIIGMATTDTVPPFTPGIGPQQGGILIKILADVFEIPDTMQDRTVNMMIMHYTLDHFSFSRPDGSSIGILYNVVPDTNCWQCNVWVGDVCMDWERISTPSDCDSLGSETCCPDSFVVRMDSIPYVDTIHVILEDGSVTVASFVCGNINGDEQGTVNVADLTYLVSFLFQGGPAPIPMASGNVNCAGGDTPNVADLTYMVAFLFQGGSPPCDGC